MTRTGPFSAQPRIIRSPAASVATQALCESEVRLNKKSDWGRVRTMELGLGSANLYLLGINSKGSPPFPNIPKRKGLGTKQPHRSQSNSLLSDWRIRYHIRP